MGTKKVLLCGIPSEPPITKVKNELIEAGAEVVIFNQRLFSDSMIDWSFIGGKPIGKLYTHNCSYDLQEFKSVYSRFMNEMDLPEIKACEPNLKEHCQQLHHSLYQWLEVTDSRVVNRHSLMFSNSSKPYQGLIIRKYGFKTPPTLITNKPKLVLEFNKKHKVLIYKSISGIRSIVKQFDPSDTDRLEKIKYCPVQFQAKLSGFDVRVHVVGNETIATKIVTTGVDYRYASKQGGETSLEPYTITNKVSKSCIKLSKALGLDFTGIDLRFTDDGDVYCFEVNPMPGYSYYESNTGQKISKVLARYLINSN